MRSAPLLVLGFLLLVIGSYFDTIRGVLLPSITSSMGIDYAKASGFLVAGYFASILCSLVLQAICAKFPLRRLVAIFLSLSIGTSVLAHFTHSYLLLILLGFLLGIGVAATGSLSNLAVIEATRPSSRSRWMCGLHIMYGVGSQAAPLLVAALLVEGLAWQTSISITAIPLFFFLIWVLTIRTPPEDAKLAVEPHETRLQAKHWLIVALMSIYGLGEVLLSSWLTAYLTSAESMSVAQAAPWVAGFFWMIAFTRAFTAFGVQPQNERMVVRAGLFGACVCFVLGRAGWLWGFPLAGILGSFFPLTVSRATHLYPVLGPRLTILGMMGLQLAVGSGHFVMGVVTDHFGIQTAYWLPGIALAITFLLSGKVFKH